MNVKAIIFSGIVLCSASILFGSKGLSVPGPGNWSVEGFCVQPQNLTDFPKNVQSVVKEYGAQVEADKILKATIQTSDRNSSTLVFAVVASVFDKDCFCYYSAIFNGNNLVHESGNCEIEQQRKLKWRLKQDKKYKGKNNRRSKGGKKSRRKNYR